MPLKEPRGASWSARMTARSVSSMMTIFSIGRECTGGNLRQAPHCWASTVPGGTLAAITQRKEITEMRKWLPLIVICTGTFMLLVDVTIVNVALPDLAAGLKTSFGSLQWVVDAYALTLAALVLGTGSIADKAGHT